MGDNGKNNYDDKDDDGGGRGRRRGKWGVGEVVWCDNPACPKLKSKQGLLKLRVVLFL